jgi:enoyl-CoA hydratase
LTFPEFRTITLELDRYVAWLTLNRPEKLNSMNDELLDELELALDLLTETDHRVVVLRGAGRAFCAGYDLSPDSEEIGYATKRGPVEDRDRLVKNIERFTRLWRHPQPIVAAVHGYCVGGGTQLATFADITIITDECVVMASPSLLIGGGYLSPLWAHLVGPKRAKLMSFDAGHRISGKTATDWGWAAESVPAAEFDAYIDELAHNIAKTPSNVLRMKKEAINRVTEMSGFLTYARMGAETDALLHLTQEVEEVQGWIRDIGLKGAIKRFKEQGVPDWTDL